MSSDKKTNRDYLAILKQVEDFHSNPERISDYQGINKSDKIFVRQNNIEILFLIRLCEKFEELSELHNLENCIVSLEKLVHQKGKDVEGQASKVHSQINEENIVKYFEKLKLPSGLSIRKLV